FIVGYDSMSMRIFVYSLGQSLPFALTLKLLLARQDGRSSPGARLAGTVAVLIVAIYAIRGVGGLLHIGNFSVIESNPAQWAVLLVLIFLSMAWNFGFLLMAIDRLRNEDAARARSDDLPGVGNRRHLLQRLTEECA